MPTASTVDRMVAANAATPVATLLKGGVVPNPAVDDGDWWLMKLLGIAIFLLAMVPLLFGGKIYNSLKAVMSLDIYDELRQYEVFRREEDPSYILKNFSIPSLEEIDRLNRLYGFVFEGGCTPE